MNKNIKTLLESLIDDDDFFEDDLMTSLLNNTMLDHYKSFFVPELKKGIMPEEPEVLEALIKPENRYVVKDKDELLQIISNASKYAKDNNIKDYTFSLNWIDIQNIDDLSHLWLGGQRNKHVNWDLSLWDVSHVKNISNLFYDVENVCDVSNWDVSNVLSMYRTFYNCRTFNQDLSKWNTKNVTTMEEMFLWCLQFNSDISNWDVSNVKNMQSMFFCCSSFNAPIGKWNVSNVKNWKEFLRGAKSFTQDLSSWDLRKELIANLDDIIVSSGIYRNPSRWPKMISDTEFKDLFAHYFEFVPNDAWEVTYDESYIEFKEYSCGDDLDGYGLYTIIIEFSEDENAFDVSIETDDPEHISRKTWNSLDVFTLTCIHDLYYDLKNYMRKNYTEIK